MVFILFYYSGPELSILFLFYNHIVKFTNLGPNLGTEVTGMGIKEGVTIITGGGFHGKSTLLNAIQYLFQLRMRAGLPLKQLILWNH